MCRPSGQGARRLRRRRHGRGGAGADARGRRRLGDGAADGECGGRRRGRQARHGDRHAGRAAAQDLPHASLAAEEKIVAAGGDLDTQLAEWRRQGLRIGFTNGCFDILHPGHVRVLTAARGACDRLVVGLNSDASVKRLKGEGRPVQDERARAEVLAALEAVDLVVIFEEDTPIDLITRVRPSVLVKGGDYTREQVVGHEIVEADGGEIVLVDILAGHSTTSLVDARAEATRERECAKHRGSVPALPVLARSGRAGRRLPMSSLILVALALPWSTSRVGDLHGAAGLSRWCRRSICGLTCDR